MENMQFYYCKRFMLEDYPNYSVGTDYKYSEIVSVDCSLFPYDERREFSGEVNLVEKEQLLAVLMIDKGDELPTLAGYEFCGFDLAEGDDFGCAGTSALTNCPHCFDEVFSFKDLNRYGLVDSRKDAERLQELLPKQYPNEPHAYCEIYAIWRKISCFYSFESSEERRAFGGSAFMELQYCKLKPSATIRKILSLRSIPYWQNDGLYVYVDDIDIFLSNYAGVFGDGVLSNRTTGSIDEFGITYYSSTQLKDIISNIEKQKPLGYEVILDWLKQGIDCNGFYVLGI